MDMPLLADQQKLTHNNSVKTQGVVRKTWWELWMIETDGKRGSVKSKLAVRLDENDDKIVVRVVQKSYIVYEFLFMNKLQSYTPKFLYVF